MVTSYAFAAAIRIISEKLLSYIGLIRNEFVFMQLAFPLLTLAGPNSAWRLSWRRPRYGSSSLGKCRYGAGKNEFGLTQIVGQEIPFLRTGHAKRNSRPSIQRWLHSRPGLSGAIVRIFLTSAQVKRGDTDSRWH